MTHLEDTMSLRSGTKYVQSTDSEPFPTPSEKSLKLNDSKVQLQSRLQSHILTRRLENPELINFAVGVKRKCQQNMTADATELWNQL